MFGIINKLRGHTGPEGSMGPQGLQGAQGASGKDGQDCKCQSCPCKRTKPGRVLYVDKQGFLGSDFSPRFSSMAEAFSELRQGDTILLYGKIDESGLQLDKDHRDVTDVTIRGMNTRTRPGKGGETAMGGGADWGNGKDNFSDPLLTIISQGWRIQNIHFGGRIKLSRTSDYFENGSHTEFQDCTFSGGEIGIDDSGGNTNVGIFGCHFYGFKKPGQVAIKGTSTAVAWPLWWEIIGNRFMWNDGHIMLDLSNGTVTHNIFFRTSPEPGLNNTLALNLAGGKNNVVAHNQFCCRSDEPGYADSAFAMGEGDVWGPNYCSDKEIYGKPNEK